MGWNFWPIPKIQRLHRWSLEIDKLSHSRLYNVCNHLSMMGLKLNHIIKRGSCNKPHDQRKAYYTVHIVLNFDYTLPLHGLFHYNDVTYASWRLKSWTTICTGDSSDLQQWKHQCFALLLLREGTGGFPYKGPVWRRALDIIILPLITMMLH